MTGRILEILRVEVGVQALVVIEQYQVSQSVHLVYDMLVLVKPFGKTSKLAVKAEVTL